MNKKQLFLTSTLLVSSISFSYAETIQLDNGDSLTVELIHQTDKTLTYSHSILGKQTIQKSAVSNLSELNLASIERVNEGAEGQADIELYDAKKNQKLAQEEVNAAKNQLTITKKETALATGVGVKVAEQKELAAGERFTTAEKELVTANTAVEAATKKLQTAANISIAGEQVNLAKLELKQAQQDEKTAQKELITAEKELDKADSASADKAEIKVDTAEDNVDLAEENTLKAKENLLLAENAVTIAKGEKVNDGFMGTGYFKDWDSTVSLGIKGASGTSVNATARLGFDTRYEDKDHRWDFKSFYYYDSEDNTASENQIHATLVKDWFFPGSPWFAYASTVYDMDQFKDWDQRLQISAGPGYQFIKTDTWEFAARAGLTGVFEFEKDIFDTNTGNIIGQDNVSNLDAMMGLDATWHITAKQRFTISNYIYPSITDAGEFRNLANIAWIHQLDWFEGLAVKFGIRDEYNTSESIPNEFKYDFSILWGF